MKQTLSKLKNLFTSKTGRLKVIIVGLTVVILFQFQLQNDRNQDIHCIAETADEIGTPLIIKTDSKFSREKIITMVGKVTLNTINELSSTEFGLENWFECEYIDIEPYTFGLDRSFNDELVYTPKFPNFTTYDKYQTARIFIKNKGLGAEYIDYMESVTKTGRSGNQASSIFFLKTEYGNSK
jgi:hypothetical protein